MSEGLLPCSQEPDTGPVLSQMQPSHPISFRSFLILSLHLRLGLTTWIFANIFLYWYVLCLF